MDFNGLYNELNKLKVEVKQGAKEGLKVGSERLLDAAKAKPGSYQPAVSPFPAWAKLKKGDSPLLKSGGLRASISKTESGDTLQIGVSGYAAIHEIGTAKIPQRAFLRPALIETKEQVISDVIDGIRSNLNIR